MPKTEAQMRAHRKYDSKHWATIAAKMRIEDAEEIKYLAFKRGVTPSKIMAEAAKEYIARHQYDDLKPEDYFI